MRTRVVKPTRREILLVESRWTGLSCNLWENNAANAGHAFLNKRNKRREMSRATRGSARQAARRQAAEAAAPEPAAAPAPPVSLGEPVTSGIDLTGTWKLDMTRSEPLDPYLRAMGLADMAVAGNRAQIKFRGA